MDKQRNNKESFSGIIGWFIGNHVAANILMMFLVIGGIISVKSMRTETFPAIDPRLITVSVQYPGATPYEVANSITNRTEEELAGIDGVKRISSVAIESLGTTNIELEDFANADDVYNEVETAINSLSEFPPQNAEEPIVTKVKITPNVMNLAIYGDVDEKTLKYWTKTIEEELKNLSEVALTRVDGIRDYQISIEVSQEKLREYNLTLQMIAKKVIAFSQDIPAGTIETNQGEISLRIKEKKYVKDDFQEIVIASLENGASLKLKDVATVIDGFEDINLSSKFNGKRAAFIQIKRSKSQDTLKIAGQVKNYLKNLKMPDKISVEIQNDETTSLKDRISLMLRNGIIGFMLVFLILLLFLDLKLAFWTSMAIPISFLGGLLIINFMGLSLNMISLFAFIVVLGIVVDDGIIVGESIFEEQENNPNNKNSVAIGVKKVITPVTIGVLTTMAAFAPLLFSTGNLGQIIGVIPAVVIPILAISLVEAYFILPSHLSSPTRWSSGLLSKFRDKFKKVLNNFIKNYLVKFIGRAIKFRYLTISIFIAIAILTSGLVKSGLVRFIFFPQVEGDQITINIETPQGSNFSVTESVVSKIEHEIEQIKQDLRRQNSNQKVFENILISLGQITSSGSALNIRLTQEAIKRKLK